jgi:hypothetical protein
MLSAAMFALFFLGCAGLAMVRHPLYGLYLYLAVFYIHPPARWWGPLLPDLRWSFLAAAVALLATLVHSKRLSNVVSPWYATTPARVMLLLTAWVWVQNVWALDSVAHWTATIQLTKYLVVFFLCYRLARSATEGRDVLLVHVAGCFFLGLLCYLSGRNYGNRLDGVGGPGIDDANSLGMVLATGVVVGAVLLLATRGWRRAVVALTLPVIVNGVILTGSRGAFLGLLAGGVIILVMRPRQSQWFFWGVAGLGVIAAISLVDRSFIDRMSTLRGAVAEGRGAMDSSAEGRLELAIAQMQMAARYPHGTGHRGTAALSAQYMDSRWLTGGGEGGDAARSSHNTLLTMLVEQGAVGVFLYAWLTLWGLNAIGRARAAMSRGTPFELMAPATACCAGLAVVWMAGQFTDYLLAEVQVWFLAVLAANLEMLGRGVLTPVEQSKPLANAGKVAAS